MMEEREKKNRYTTFNPSVTGSGTYQMDPYRKPRLRAHNLLTSPVEVEGGDPLILRRESLACSRLHP